MILLMLVIIDTAGYMAIEGVEFSKAVYMTIISITTVGYREVFPLSTTGIFFTIWVILSGIGLVFYITVSIAEDVFEGRVRKIFGRRKMKRFLQLKDHVIVAGFGRMGEYVCRELAERKLRFVIIENDSRRFAKAEEKEFDVLLEDATKEETLLLAGVDRAKIFISLLSSDADNIFTVLSCRELNPAIFIITRALDSANEKKLYKIGADRVISPYELGSRRIVNTVLKPNVVEFIDTMTYHSQQISFSIEEYAVKKDSPFAEREIKGSGFREQHNAIIVAIKRNGKTLFNPGPTEKILTGDILILVGEKQKIV